LSNHVDSSTCSLLTITAHDTRRLHPMINRSMHMLVDSYRPVPLTMVSHTRALHETKPSVHSQCFQGAKTHPDILNGIPRLPWELSTRAGMILFLLLSRHRHCCARSLL
jgi:hypothetical protein